MKFFELLEKSKFPQLHKNSEVWFATNILSYAALIAVAVLGVPVGVPLIVIGALAAVKFLSALSDPGSFLKSFFEDIKASASFKGILWAMTVAVFVVLGNVLDVISQPLKWGLLAGFISVAEGLKGGYKKTVDAALDLSESASKKTKPENTILKKPIGWVMRVGLFVGHVALGVLTAVVSAAALPIAWVGVRLQGNRRLGEWLEARGQAEESWDRDLWQTTNQSIMQTRGRKAKLLDLSKDHNITQVMRAVYKAPLHAFRALLSGDSDPKLFVFFGPDVDKMFMDALDPSSAGMYGHVKSIFLSRNAVGKPSVLIDESKNMKKEFDPTDVVMETQPDVEVEPQGVEEEPQGVEEEHQPFEIADHLMDESVCHDSISTRNSVQTQGSLESDPGDSSTGKKISAKNSLEVARARSGSGARQKLSTASEVELRTVEKASEGLLNVEQSGKHSTDYHHPGE